METPANDAPPSSLVTLERDPEDDRGFLSTIEPLLNGAVALSLPPELWLVRVEGWFDRRWLRFSGKTLGALGLHTGEDQVPTVPPFKPSRVRSQCLYRWSAEGGRYLHDRRPFWLHPNQPSEDNLRRRLDRVAPGAGFAWYTTTAGPEHRGALMAYLPLGGRYWTWYAAFARAVPWRITTLEGIGRAELKRLRLA